MDAERHLKTTYPHDARRPDPDTLPAVRAMIEAAIDCIIRSQP